jgi:TolA-binding protein
MKKLILITIAALIMTGCANDQYAIEKEYWQLTRQATKIFKNPAASPPNELEKVVKTLDKFVDDHPKNRLAVKAGFDIVMLYITKEEYTQARKYLDRMLINYSEFEPICAEAVFFKGFAYEKDGNWPAALEQYQKVMQKYALTSRGIAIPIYIAEKYKARYEPDKSIQAYRDAIVHYRTYANKYADSPLGFNLNMLVAQCHTSIKDWQGTIDTFNHMLTQYNGKLGLEEVMLNMAGIYAQQLNNKTKATEILNSLITQYPKSRYVKVSRDLIKRLSAKK